MCFIPGSSTVGSSGSAAAVAMVASVANAPTLINRLFALTGSETGHSAAAITPVTSPLASPVASPRHHLRPAEAAMVETRPPSEAMIADGHSQGGHLLRPSSGGNSNSFVFPSSDGGSLLVQRLVPPDHGQAPPVVHLPSHHAPTPLAQPPPPSRLPNCYVSQHPLKPFSTPRTDPTVPPGHKEHGFNLVGRKYLLLDQLEGSHLQRCIDVQTQMEYVCKVRPPLLYHHC